MRSVAVGAVLALVFIVLLAVGTVGYFRYLDSRQPLDEVLVIATAPGEEGGAVAALAFTVDARTGDVRILDTMANAALPGTSARNAKDAFAFGGGAGVAEALVAQTNGHELDWVVLPAATWSEIIERAGGIEIDVPEGFSAYSDGTLTVLESGRSTISGPQAVALASSAEYFSTSGADESVLRALAQRVADVVTGGGGAALRTLVESGDAVSSVDARRIPALDR